MSKCIECQSFDVRSFPNHTKEKLAKCKKMGSGKFVPINRDLPCNEFQAAPEAIILKRRHWRDGK